MFLTKPLDSVTVAKKSPARNYPAKNFPSEELSGEESSGRRIFLLREFFFRAKNSPVKNYPAKNHPSEELSGEKSSGEVLSDEKFSGGLLGIQAFKILGSRFLGTKVSWLVGF
jgi:hypothetical protein